METPTIDDGRDLGETPVGVDDFDAGRGPAEYPPTEDGLLPPQEAAFYDERWRELQARFVDEPRRAVEEADELVEHVVRRLVEGFTAERQRLEAHWERGEEASTEDLRVALQRYRSFFRRLLTT